MIKYLLTDEERKEWETSGKLALVLKGGEMFSPGEVVRITAEHRTLIDAINAEIRGTRVIALHGPRYGKEPFLSLIRSIDSARSIIETARGYAPECTVTDAPKVLFESGTFIEKMTCQDRLKFIDDAAAAVVGGDADFFYRVAEVLTSYVPSSPADRWTLDLQSAYRELLGNVPEIIPTKKQVRELALHKHAFADAWNQTDPANRSDRAEFGKTHADEIATAKRRLVKSDATANQKMWTERFRKAGLRRLKSDRGGKPAHRKP